MRTRMSALILGILSLQLLPVLPAGGLLAGLGLSGLLLLIFWRSPGLFLLGVCWACLFAQQAMNDRLQYELDGRVVWLQGRISGLPEVSDNVTYFYLTQARSRRGELPDLLRLSWQEAPVLQPGEHWRLAVKLKRPRGSLNPQHFDYEAWALAKGIGATGSVRAGERLEFTTDGFDRWRAAIRQRILVQDASGREGVIAALVIGDGSALADTDWQLLQRTGTVHLMVISGQHIGLLAGILYGLVFLLNRYGVWPVRWPWLPCACALALCGALSYGALAGFGVPVQRACVMVALTLLWRLRFQNAGIFWPWLLALLMVLLIDPLAPLQSGFWLSFIAVFLLIMAFAGRLGQAYRGLRLLVYSQWIVVVGLLPFMLALGLPAGPGSIPANMLAIPLMSLIVPLALLGTLLLPVPGLGEGLLNVAGSLLTFLFVWLEQVAAWSPVWFPSRAPWWSWLLAVLGALWILLPRGVPGRFCGVLLLLPAIFPMGQTPLEGEAEVWLFDVGQGSSILVRTSRHALLYDAGPRFRHFDSGARIIMPSLQALDVRHLNMLLLSHADNDHAGGALAVHRAVAVDTVMSGEPEHLPDSLQALPCDERSWQWDGVTFQTWRWADAMTDNQRSCVLRVEARGESLLLTGDLDHAAERALLGTELGRSVDWLLAPHHGSRTSSSHALLQRLQPGSVLISRGWGNSFGHPHAEVIARYEKISAVIYDTAERGAVKIALGRRTVAYGLRDRNVFWRENDGTKGPR